jgi:hypothetical protein
VGEEDENGDEDVDEDTTEYKPYVMRPDPRFNRGNMCFHQGTRVPWLESDDLRLLAYRTWCKLCSVWELNKRLDSKSMEIK